MSDITTIPLKKKTRDHLKKIGHKGETYDTLINRLLMIAEQYKFYIKQKRILKDEEFNPLDGI
ncbi:MAG: DUF7557 family protein [Promethearchaeota archaeon]